VRIEKRKETPMMREERERKWREERKKEKKRKILLNTS